MRSASLCAYSAEKLFLIEQCRSVCGRSKRIFTRGVWNELPQSKPIGFDSSLWEGAFGTTGRVATKPQSGLPGSDPFRLAASRQATFPKGTAFSGGGKVSGTTQRRPLGGAGERSEPEGVFPARGAHSKSSLPRIAFFPAE